MFSMELPTKLDGCHSSAAKRQVGDMIYASSSGRGSGQHATHDVQPPNDLPAALLDPLQGRHLLQQIDNLYSEVSDFSTHRASGYYGLGTNSYPDESVGILRDSHHYHGPQDYMGTDLTRGFAEDAQLLLGQCANSNLNEWFIPAEQFAWAATYDNSQLTIQDHHTTIGSDYASFSPIQSTPDSTTTVIAPIISSVHGTLLPPIQGLLGCPHGCRGTFGRPGEYRRHMRKHANPTFFCTQHGCSKSFYRRDKLNDHLRQKHGIVQPRRARGAAVIGATSVAPTTGHQA